MKSIIKEKIKKIIILFVTFIILLSNSLFANVQAASLGGILFKPTATILALGLGSVDIQIGLMLKGPLGVAQSGTNIVHTIITLIKEKAKSSDELDDNDTVDYKDSDGNAAKLILNNIFIGPDSIFRGDIDLFNANIFNNIDWGVSWNNVSTKSNSYMGVKLRSTVAQFYVILRNICAIVMLIGLIYTGIKVLISGNLARGRSEWLIMLQDWLVGLVLLIMGHIIMILIFEISDTLVNALGATLGENRWILWNFVNGLL